MWPNVNVRVVLAHPEAQMPTRSGLSAGYDVRAVEGTTIRAGGRGVVRTGLRVAVPEGHYLRVAPRSGLALRHGVQTGAGVVDEDYRGEVMVLLFNHGDDDFEVAVGDRVAQLIFERISTPRLVTVESLDATDRGEGGFGSTGK